MGVGGQRHAPGPLYSRERPDTHCIGGWVGHRDGLEGCGKSRPPPPGFDPRIVQVVDIPGPQITLGGVNNAASTQDS